MIGLDGELFEPGSAGYEELRRPADLAYRHVRPRCVVACRTVRDVAATVAYAAAHGERLVPRGGGHCFAGRSSTDGIQLDLGRLDSVQLDSHGIATLGAGVRLGRMYAALHAAGRTLPAGCGAGVGIAGLTLGGGIGLLGRAHGLTCDRLVGAQVVLADGSVVECDGDREPALFWALRGAGGGQFGVVTPLQFDTVAEPTAVRIEALLGDVDLDELVAAWQAWAPTAPREVTVNLTVVSEPGEPVTARLFGASLLGETTTRELLAGYPVRLRADMAFHQLKRSFDEPSTGRDVRSRSALWAHPMSRQTVSSLMAALAEPRPAGRREIAFTAMGGAYDDLAANATAFAHRDQRFLVEHIGAPDDPWVDVSWALARGSGRVYPNFPDPVLDNARTAYHAGNLPRLEAVKKTYDSQRFFDFPQAI